MFPPFTLVMAPVFSKPRGKYFTYTENDMANAILAVNDDKMKIATAARTFGVPRKTLADRIAGTHSNSRGKPKTLTDEEEIALVNYITYMDSQCFPLTIIQIRAFAWEIAVRSGRKIQFKDETGPTEKWWRDLKRGTPS